MEVLDYRLNFLKVLKGDVVLKLEFLIYSY